MISFFFFAGIWICGLCGFRIFGEILKWEDEFGYFFASKNLITGSQLNFFAREVSVSMVAVISWPLVKYEFHRQIGTRKRKVCIFTGLWLLAVLLATSEATGVNPFFSSD